MGQTRARWILPIVALMVSLSITVFSEAVDTKEQSQSNASRTETFEIKIHPGLPIYVFRAEIKRLEEGPYELHQIQVFKKGNPKVIQLLDCEFDERGDRMANLYSSEDLNIPKHPLIQGEDINFDGYQDLKLRVPGGTGGVPYLYWLFDKKTDLFKTPPIWLINPWRNLKTREIEAYESLGYHGLDHIEWTYKFVHGSLTLLREEDQNEIENRQDYFLRVIKKRKNGKMIVVKKEIVHIPPR